MGKGIVSTNLRLNLEKEADRRAWEYLQRLDRKTHKSYSHAVITAINDFFGRQERLLNDPYLETREKEDAFLQRVLETITKGVQEAAALGMTGEMRPSLQGITATNTASEPSDAEKEKSIKDALAFCESFF